MGIKARKAQTLEGNNDKVCSAKSKAIQGIRYRYWAFTYNNYEGHEEAFKIGLKKLCSMFHYGHEVGEETGTRHLQGFLHTKNKEGLRLTEMWKKDCMEGVTVKPAYASEWNNFIYTSKGQDLVYFGPARLRVIVDLRPFQLQIESWFEEEPDDTTINWVVDYSGGKGKTAFCKYLYLKWNAIIMTKGSYNDLAQILAGCVKNGRNLNNKTVIVLNYAKDMQNISYHALEAIKDGLMTSPKYESNTLVFNTPHLVCFTNKLPRLDGLSKHKWKIWLLTGENEFMENITHEALRECRDFEDSLHDPYEKYDEEM